MERKIGEKFSFDGDTLEVVKRQAILAKVAILGRCYFVGLKV